MSPSLAPSPFASTAGADRDADSWVTYTEEQAHYSTARWVQQQLRQERRRGRAAGLEHADATGGDPGRHRTRVLPCFVGDNDPLLERLTPPVPEIAAEYWVIVHRDLRRAVCVRAVIDWVRRPFDEHRDALAGAR